MEKEENVDVLLQRFCSTDEMRLSIATPFSIGDFTYATDGAILIRIPRVLHIECREEVPDINVMPWDHEIINDWESLPDYEIDPSEVCPVCKGSKASKECFLCEGVAEITCPTAHAEIECPTCDGYGDVPASEGGCNWCISMGVSPFKEIHWHNRKISLVYLEMMKSLPGIVLSKQGKAKEVIRFKFDGGVGLVMPRRAD